MSVIFQNLLEITRKKLVSESDLDYFEEHVEDFPDKWGNLYLWSIQCKNYRLSDYLLESGLELNSCEEVKWEVIKSYTLFGLYSERIIQDGFIITPEIYHSIINTYSNDKYFDNDRLDSDYKKSLFLSRKKKITRLKNNLHQKRCSVVI